MAEPALNRDVGEAKLFRNNRSQAVRIPAEFEFSGSRVLIHKEGIASSSSLNRDRTSSTPFGHWNRWARMMPFQTIWMRPCCRSRISSCEPYPLHARHKHRVRLGA
ncbi:hypothetical protein QE385_003950 [Sphingomonas sp. SORGH_AS 950]|uniref:antitoxin n=1 Tax=Sphingomonas sp. SORGH_AS_0950 TaxID=3041792 RepID=UPI00277DE5B7|nr:hypothetical protein [Sphingomonas sp. SORGH_AS_0950]MDQ1159553.1 hypothetical protein [Sphingomonas sp. SORGH_AS_0950]